MRALAGVLLAAAAFGGCQTVGGGPHQEVEIPAVLGPLFVNCLPGDGAFSLQVFHDDQLLGTVDAEWLAKPNGDWDIELTNAVGQAVLTLRRRGDDITSVGRLAAKTPKLGVRPSGFLDVAGHLVGIKAAEVPCLLGFGFPRGWLAIADAISVSDRDTTVWFADPVREIELSARALGGRRDAGTCAAISWKKLLFLRHELTWCQANVGRRTAELSGFQDYRLKWVKIDER